MREILFFEITPEEKKYFSKALGGIKDIKVSFYPFPLTSSSWKQKSQASLVVVFINSRVDKKVLNLFPQLQGIITRSTGFDHIDVEACQEKGVIVQNLGDYSAQSVAETTISFMFALLGRLKERMQRVEAESSFLFQGLEGEELQNKTVGIVGTGCIGERVAKMLLGMGVKVLGFDLYPKKSLERYRNFSYVSSLSDLYRQADIISFHVPLTKGTFHLFSRQDLKIIKEGVYIVNTSRGEIVETEALLEGLRSKKIRGVALDVIEGESRIKEKNKFSPELKRLLRFPNVIVTPHTAFFTKESRERQLLYTLENIRSFLKGKPKRRVA